MCYTFTHRSEDKPVWTFCTSGAESMCALLPCSFNISVKNTKKMKHLIKPEQWNTNLSTSMLGDTNVLLEKVF